ncbi:MAG: SpoIIE family protein phosphatase [Bdellovibrionaceae bacterium]|nr:SpoIIE family protein phosphatase [Pseudobdellovibrionaceae bacterium]MDW8190376.1 SpoIIE family protein phosphatase [Pseudobdellovibrionaceae bacterium]
MRLSFKILLIFLFLLLLSLSSVYFLFQYVLKPEFDRQQEEIWFNRAELIARNLVNQFRTVQLLNHLVTENKDQIENVKNFIDLLFKESAFDGFFLLDTKSGKIMLRIEKDNQETIALPAVQQIKDTVFVLENKLWWKFQLVGLTSLAVGSTHEIFFSENESLRVALYFLDSGKSLVADDKTLQLSKDLERLLKDQNKINWAYRLPNDRSYLFVSYPIPDLNLGVLVFGKDTFLEDELTNMNIKFLGLIMVVLGVSLLIALGLSKYLTKRLERLTKQAHLIGLGQWDVEFSRDTNDEIGQLSEVFGQMVQKIKKLFKDQEEKNRMESELKIAQTVQDTLFPPSILNTDGVILMGLYRSASECGGDLWGYWETERYLYFYILDATGHGVSSALLTSASRSIFAHFEQRGDVALEEIATSLNYATFRVGNKTLQSTGFVAKLEKSSGHLEYINASHVSGYIFPARLSEESKVSDLREVHEPINRRFGESESIHVQQGQITLDIGDTLVLMTDGVFEIQSFKGKLTEKKFLKILIKLFLNQPSFDLTLLDHLINHELNLKPGVSLSDDVTLLFLRRF